MVASSLSLFLFVALLQDFANSVLPLAIFWIFCITGRKGTHKFAHLLRTPKEEKLHRVFSVPGGKKGLSFEWLMS